MNETPKPPPALPTGGGSFHIVVALLACDDEGWG